MVVLDWPSASMQPTRCHGDSSHQHVEAAWKVYVSQQKVAFVLKYATAATGKSISTPLTAVLCVQCGLQLDFSLGTHALLQHHTSTPSGQHRMAVSAAAMNPSVGPTTRHLQCSSMELIAGAVPGQY